MTAQTTQLKGKNILIFSCLSFILLLWKRFYEFVVQKIYKLTEKKDGKNNRLLSNKFFEKKLCFSFSSGK